MPFTKALKNSVKNLSAEQLRAFIIHRFSDAQFKAWHNYLKENGFSPSGMNSEGNGSLHERLVNNTQQTELLSSLDKYAVDITGASVDVSTLEHN